MRLRLASGDDVSLNELPTRRIRPARTSSFGRSGPDLVHRHRRTCLPQSSRACYRQSRAGTGSHDGGRVWMGLGCARERTGKKRGACQRMERRLVRAFARLALRRMSSALGDRGREGGRGDPRATAVSARSGGGRWSWCRRTAGGEVVVVVLEVGGFGVQQEVPTRVRRDERCVRAVGQGRAQC